MICFEQLMLVLHVRIVAELGRHPLGQHHVHETRPRLLQMLAIAREQLQGSATMSSSKPILLFAHPFNLFIYNSNTNPIHANTTSSPILLSFV